LGKPTLETNGTGGTTIQCPFLVFPVVFSPLRCFDGPDCDFTTPPILIAGRGLWLFGTGKVKLWLFHPVVTSRKLGSVQGGALTASQPSSLGPVPSDSLFRR
jgi:hypothetical protein